MVIVTLFTKAKVWIQFIGRITGVDKKNVADKQYGILRCKEE